MRLPRQIASAALLASLAACTTVASRVKSHQAAFDASAPDVQEKIRRGNVGVGFTKDQVVMALGVPNRTYAKVTPAGEQEIWVYGMDYGPGTGTIPRYGDGGIVVGDAYFEENQRVLFEKGVVTSVVKRLR